MEHITYTFRFKKDKREIDYTETCTVFNTGDEDYMQLTLGLLAPWMRMGIIA